MRRAAYRLVLIASTVAVTVLVACGETNEGDRVVSPTVSAPAPTRAAVAPAPTPTVVAPTPSPAVVDPVSSDTVVNRIAYVSPDGRIFVVHPDGSGVEPASPDDGFFTWPTWSSDASKLVFSGVINQDIGMPQSVLYSLDRSTGRVAELHRGEPGFTGVVAEDTPHYAFWSPDGERLAFIGVSSRGLQLYLDDLRDDAGPEPILDQGPLWIDWSPDSRFLMVHRGGDHILLDADDGTMTWFEISSQVNSYRVPKWNHAGDALTLVTEEAGLGPALHVLGIDPDERTLADATTPIVSRVPQQAAFLWSPDGQHLAVTVPERAVVFSPLGLMVYPRLGVIGTDRTGLPAADIHENVIAFFWSPDSSKLAYVTLGGRSGVMSWNILDVAQGETWSLTEFIPSSDQLTVFRFFDQFAPSHSLWSPDSQSLVFAGRFPDRGSSTSSQQRQTDHIIVLATYPRPLPEVIADGRLAFWSPK